MNRDAFTGSFHKDGELHWVCPHCEKGTLAIKEGTFQRDERRASREAHDHEAWDPEWIDYAYSCLLQCTNPGCKEIVASTGRGSVEYNLYYDEDGRTQGDVVDYFFPLYFHPPLKIFQWPERTPASVADRLTSSFRVFFSDPPAALMHLRASVEELLTHFGIRKSEVVKGRKMFVSLHRRIELLPEKHRDLGRLLLAVKWLGNAGSHGGNEVTTTDVLDAYDLVSAALTMVFDPKAADAVRLARKINKSKGRKKKTKFKDPFA